MDNEFFGDFSPNLYSPQTFPFTHLDDPDFWDRVLLSQRSPLRSKPPGTFPPESTSSTAVNNSSKVSAMATSTMVTRSAAHSDEEGPKHKKMRKSLD